MYTSSAQPALSLLQQITAPPHTALALHVSDCQHLLTSLPLFLIPQARQSCSRKVTKRGGIKTAEACEAVEMSGHSFVEPKPNASVHKPAVELKFVEKLAKAKNIKVGRMTLHVWQPP